jgi:hypothetical protein
MTDILQPYGNFLDTIKIPLRLSCRTESGWPMILSLWFLYQDGSILCATREGAKVVSYLQAEPRCAFEIAGDLPPYCGVRGQARARIDRGIGVDTLKKLLLKYQGGLETPLAENLLAKSTDEVAIILEPANIYQWDFSERMDPSDPGELNIGVCP